ncbi:MAG: hypothetical protein ACRBEE_10350 [Arenicella sp.]
MTHCKYHPLVPAQRYCDYCAADLCPQCSLEPSSYRQNSEYRCFVCNSALERLNPEDLIDPFWRRMPEIHRYPFNVSGIAAIIFTSLAMLMTVVLGPLFILFSMVVLLMYCFSCLSETTIGNLEPPSFLEVMNGGAGLILGLIGIYLVAATVIGFAFGAFGVGLGILITILFVIAIPAILMVLAIERSMISALNVGRIIQIITACGSSYLLMLLFIMVLSGSMNFVSSLIVTENPLLFIFLGTVVSSYYTIIIFHVMGYMVYQNSYELDFYVQEKDDDVVKTRPDDKLAEMEVELLLKDGQYQQATEKYFQLLKVDTSNNLRWKKYFNLVTETKNVSAIKQFADRYFEKLLSNDDRPSLAQSYKTFKGIVKDFEPKNAEMKLSIAEALLLSREYKMVTTLLVTINSDTDDKSLVKRGFELIAKAYEAIPEQSHKSKRFTDMAKMINVDV